MKVMNENLKGMVSFRGLGYVEIDGLLMPVCGQEVIDLGNGAEVRYVEQQIVRITKSAPRVRGVFYGELFYDGDLEDWFYRRADGKILLQEGFLEEIPLGLSVGGAGELFVRAPFRLRLDIKHKNGASGLTPELGNAYDPICPGFPPSDIPSSSSYFGEVFIIGA